MKSPSRDIFGAEFNGTPSHHRVLKPPGGGSSDIFGTGSQDAATPRRVKNHQQSNLFLNDDPAPVNTPSRSHGKDTYSRLFGAPPVTPGSSSKNWMKSNIVLTDEDTANSNNEQHHDGTKSPSTDSTDGQMNGENGHGHSDDGQVNGGGQQVTMNGNSGPVNGNPAPQAPVQPRTRVPPGGYSSGLW